MTTSPPNPRRELSSSEIRVLDRAGLVEIITTPPGPYSMLTVAHAYVALGERPIPLCDPEHKHVSQRHRTGYVGRDGRVHLACTSPGKAPLESSFPRFAKTPPTDLDLLRMFRDHQGNIGLVVKEGEVVLDIDPRNGGGESLQRYLAEHGPLPATVATLTGGGGTHFRFALPSGVKINAGGNLEKVGYPGMEWKGPGGQVVAPPAIHANSRSYLWAVGSALIQVPLAETPAPLLALIQAAIGRPPAARGAGGRPSADHCGTTPKYTREQHLAFFQDVYHEGSRRSGTGVPRLAGILRALSVPEDQALDFFLRWQQVHLAPPLSTGELTATVQNIYRYGPPPSMSQSTPTSWRWNTP